MKQHNLIILNLTFRTASTVQLEKVESVKPILEFSDMPCSSRFETSENPLGVPLLTSTLNLSYKVLNLRLLVGHSFIAVVENRWQIQLYNLNLNYIEVT